MEGPWPGRLALAARPRGGDWLEDEIAAWRHEGVDAICSLLTAPEERDLQLEGEEAEAAARGLGFHRIPIEDRETPTSKAAFAAAIEALLAELVSDRNLVPHCRQGIGRTGLVAACLLVAAGIDPEAAVARLSAARGQSVPETDEQQRWIDRFAAHRAT